MKVKDFLKIKKEYTLNDFKDFCCNIGYEQLRKDMNEVTGFEHPKLNLNTLENYSDEDIKNSEIIDEDGYC